MLQLIAAPVLMALLFLSLVFQSHPQTSAAEAQPLPETQPQVLTIPVEVPQDGTGTLVQVVWPDGTRCVSAMIQGSVKLVCEWGGSQGRSMPIATTNQERNAGRSR